MHPAELLVFCQKCAESPKMAREDYATLSCSVQLFALGLRAQGIGYKWSTGEMVFHPLTYQALNINREEFEVVGFIWVGIADSLPGLRKRPELNDVLLQLD